MLTHVKIKISEHSSTVIYLRHHSSLSLQPKYTKFKFDWGSASDHTGRAYSTPLPRPLAGGKWLAAGCYDDVNKSLLMSVH